MVVLTITPFKGSGSRAFPSVGSLGLGPVSLAGAVRVKLQEDNRPVQASSLVVRVRCYESMGSGSGSPTSDGATSSFSSSAASPYPPSSSASASNRAASGHPTSASLGRAGSSNGNGTSSPAPSPVGTQPGAFTEMLRGNNNGRGKVLYEKSITLWSSPASTPPAAGQGNEEHGYPPRAANQPQFAPLGNFEKAWRLVIPPEAVEQGAKSTQIFKNWRIWWAVEAVISHIPLGMHGDRIIKTHQLSLINYAPLPSIPRLNWSTSHAPAPFEYSIDGPPGAVGASDPVAFQVRLRKDASTSDLPKKVIIDFHRDLVYKTADLPSSSAANAEDSRRSSTGRRGSNFTLTSQSNVSRKRSSGSGFYDILPPMSAESPFIQRTPPQAIPTPVAIDENGVENYFGISPIPQRRASAAMEMAHQQQETITAGKRRREDVVLASFSADVRFDSDGKWSGTVKGLMPKAKSLYHYALGETCITKNASSRFYFVVKFQHRSRSHVHELPPQDIFFSTVSSEERTKAIAELPKLDLLQKAERELLGVRPDPCEEPALSETLSIKSTNVRRRSEQPEQLDVPRVRPRFGSTPNGGLTPIIGSPVLSLHATAARPRTGTSRKQASAASPRMTRPRSAGGVSMSGTASTQSSSSPHHFTRLNIATSSHPPSPIMPHTSDSPRSLTTATFAYPSHHDESKHPPLPANQHQLFANFAGFAPTGTHADMGGPPVQDVYIAPKPGVPVSKSSSRQPPKSRGHQYKTAQTHQISLPTEKSLSSQKRNSGDQAVLHASAPHTSRQRDRTSSQSDKMQWTESQAPPRRPVVNPSQPLSVTHSTSSSSASSCLNTAPKKKGGFSFPFFRKASKV